ncbi:hypothetical protein [Lachnoclostridium sp. Marseille-P6806]|uniref:hypothetical protein n=1 Tax=Lachnoclostridium sp. Marseille-P6806 TaxID=2364793 RepID=UPI00102F445D|nr:hypothetical protein [Lachnoclostridium sp. Marseille-P6806]
MALTYGFFNSQNGDRKYNADQMSSIFDGIIEDGVYMTIANRFNVAAGDGMSVTVDTGRAWFNHTWTVNDSKLILDIDKQIAPLHRIDSIVLEVNHALDYRRNEIKVIKGMAEKDPLPPTLEDTTEVFYHKIADVYVKNTDETTAINDSDITNYVGTSTCPYVTAPLKTINADQLLQQWNAQWREEFSNQTDAFRSKYEELATYTGLAQEHWSAWFANIKHNLSGDVAGNLQLQIEKLGSVTEVTLSKDNWEESDGRYHQTVSLPGAMNDSIIEIHGNVNAAMDTDAQKAYLRAYNAVACGYGTVTTDSVTFYTYKKPVTTISLKIKGV